MSNIYKEFRSRVTAYASGETVRGLPLYAYWTALSDAEKRQFLDQDSWEIESSFWELPAFMFEEEEP